VSTGPIDQLRLRLIDGFEARIGDRSVKVNSSAARLLIGYLAMTAAKSESRDRFMSCFPIRMGDSRERLADGVSAAANYKHCVQT
jgi:hypothetical protein